MSQVSQVEAEVGGPYQPVVTISASYGASGSVIAPALAERLGVPFVDRLLTVDVTEAARRSELDDIGHPLAQPPAEPGRRSGEALSEHEQAASPGSRMFAYLARAASIGTLSAPPFIVDTDDELRQQAEAGLEAIKAGQAGVVLGRAGAVVLARRPRTFHVRLDGPVGRRVKAAARLEGVSENEAASRQVQTDKSRLLWVKRLYRADPENPGWYHLWVDSTVLTTADVVELLSMALERFLAAGA